MTAIPFKDHCGIEEGPACEGKARATALAAAPLTNSRGNAHGGLLMTMLDIAMGRAAQSFVANATSFSTIDLHVSFLSPASGHLTADGTVLRGGKSIVFCEGSVFDETGTLVARASGLFKPQMPKSV